MATIRQLERRLAVMTNWAVCAPFAIGLIQSGLAGDRIAVGLLGFAILIIGFIAQIIINAAFGGGFNRGEIAFGIGGFGVAVFAFIVGWIADPEFGGAAIIINLTGFAALIASFLIYLTAKYGLKGAFSMFHHAGDR
jgi:hypothetical protein